MEHVYLSRRNLLILLSKLDRKAAGEETACAIIKNDDKHPKYAQSMDQIKVHAVEDDEYYTDRRPGSMHPSDEAKASDPRKNPDSVAEVRRRTDAPMMECKKALFACDGDVEKAVEYVMTYRWRGCRLASSTERMPKCSDCNDTGLVEGLDTYGGSPTFEDCHCSAAVRKPLPYDERGWEPN